MTIAALSDATIMTATAMRGAILVVDDDDLVRLTLANVLEVSGYHVIHEGSAEAALTRLHGHDRISMLLTDVRLSGMSGLELADEVREQLPWVRVILMSGHFLPRATNLRLLRKPFHTHDLIAAVAAEIDCA